MDIKQIQAIQDDLRTEVNHFYDEKSYELYSHSDAFGNTGSFVALMRKE